MKRVSVLMVTGIFFLMIQIVGQAQTAMNSNDIKAKEIHPFQIAVGFNKTSNLIFPYAIKSVDRGSQAILAQKAKGAENVLQIKAGKLNFPTTNLSIITADAQLYSFLVEYSDEPSVLNLCFYKDSLIEKDGIRLTDMPVNEEELNSSAEMVLNAKRFLHYHTREQKIRITLRSIFLYKNLMWFDLQLKNKSLIDYEPDYMRFFVRDKKRSKRTAIQEKEIKPLFTLPCPSIEGETNRHIVMAFSPFTIPKNQLLVVQVGEKNGGRTLLLKLKHKSLLRARIISN